MAVSSITIHAPHDGFNTHNLRILTSITWSGGTGPFDVVYEWDTVDTFNSGNLITDTNVSATSPDEGTPPSDMGDPGTAWFCRVNVEDTDDSNVLTEPSSGGNEITFLDPVEENRYLYVSHMITVSFGAGEADGDPIEFTRYLYLYHNVGVGFGPGLSDGNPIDFDRFLYVNHNIDSNVPVPWIRTIQPTILSQGDGLTIFGQGFDNVARDWNAEARLHNTPELDDTFVALSETGFVAGTGSDEDVLTVTVPGGTSSGWVVVMNDNGL